MLLTIPTMIDQDRTSLITIAGAERDYATLRSAAARVTGLLAGLGIGPGDRVGLFATNSIESVEVLFGAAAAGAVVVPMNYRAKSAEVAHLLRDSGTRVVFTEERYRDLIESARPESVECVIVLDGDYPLRRDESDALDEVVDVGDGDLAVILYTSGTTSLPKGVMLTHGALVGYVVGTTDAADGTDRGRTVLAAPMYHIAGLASLLNSTYTGRSVILLPQFDTPAWLTAVERFGATSGFLVPTMLARLLDDPGFSPGRLSSLESITYGAAPMPPAVIRRAIEMFPPSVSFSGSYGQTETTSTVTVLDPDDHRLTGTPSEVEQRRRRLRSVGRPVSDVELRVVDEHGVEVRSGVVGEVWLRTSRTMAGYWRREGDPHTQALDEDGWIRTGDVGYLDDQGYLFLEGRTGDLIIRGGENISPEEIEAALYEHPDVLDAGVAGIPDTVWGERVMAAVVMRPGSAADEETLLAFCGDRLASFKRPNRIIAMATLPRTSTGKLLRRDLIPILSEAALS